MKLLAAVKDIFGTITPPEELKPLTDKGGEVGISFFLSQLVVLIFSISMATTVIMLVWAAFEWITSGGQKEQVAAAQKKIINTIVGVIILSVTFAVLQVLGDFTGFKFFTK